MRKNKMLYMYTDSKQGPYLETYQVTKETPKGYWITDPLGNLKKWVRKDVLLFQDKKTALADYLKRKQRQVELYHNICKEVSKEIKDGRRGEPVDHGCRFSEFMGLKPVEGGSQGEPVDPKIKELSEGIERWFLQGLQMSREELKKTISKMREKPKKKK